MEEQIICSLERDDQCRHVDPGNLGEIYGCWIEGGAVKPKEHGTQEKRMSLPVRE
jgi:hypothetical protein